jgi:ATP-dependent helicase/nuclease subunit B
MEHEYSHSNLHSGLALHVGGEMELLERVRQSPKPKELVVAPVELHQRNVQRRLREENKPKDVFEFDDPVGVCRRILRAESASTEAIDRIDRLALVRALLDDSSGSTTPSVSLPAGIDSRDPQHVEQIRAEVEAVTNFHPERTVAWEQASEELSAPIDVETAEVLEVGLDVERALRKRTAKATSEMYLVRRATRALTTTGGAAWRNAFAEIERFSLVGLSSISAPLADFVHALVATTTLDVHVHFRPATGKYLKSRMPDLIDVSEPGRVVFE